MNLLVFKFTENDKQKTIMINTDSISTITETDDGKFDVFYEGQYWTRSEESFNNLCQALSESEDIQVVAIMDEQNEESNRGILRLIKK